MTGIDRELLRRYLSGEARPDECELVDAWLKEDPGRWARLADLRSDVNDAALSETAIQQARAEVWARLEQDLGREVGEPAAIRLHNGVRIRDFAPSSRRPFPSRLVAGV